MNFQYDFTGTKEEFAVTQEAYVVFSEHQKIKLSYPAYTAKPGSEGSILTSYFKIELVDESTGSVSKTFAPSSEDGLTYTVLASEDGDRAKSDAICKNTDPAFNPDICQVVQINYFGKGASQVQSKFKILVTYHAVRMDWTRVSKVTDLYDKYSFEGDHPRYSPALMQRVLDRLTNLETASAAQMSLFGTALDSDEILDEDTTGYAPENFVQYERHVVNTSAGINLLQPAKGSFYPNGLKIITYVAKPFSLTVETAPANYGKLFIYSDDESVLDNTAHISTEKKVILSAQTVQAILTGKDVVTGKILDLTSSDIRTLTQGEDYELDSIDIPRTARSTNTNGVYQQIRFIRPLSQEVMISYQAFGGMVAASDIRALHQHITNTRAILKGAELITAGSLEQQPFILEVNRRLRMMEEYHNHFNQVEHRVSIQGSGWHWFNIAQLYDNKFGILMRNINDIGQFRIQSALKKWSYEFMVDADLSRPEGDQLHLTTLGTNQYAGFDPTNITKALFRDNVAVRLCWIDEGDSSGLMLQIGLDFSSYQTDTPNNDFSIDTDTILVTNKSSTASLWALIHDPDQVNQPANGLVSIWNHNKYVETADKTFDISKVYYKFEDRLIYIRTADAYFKEGKTYYVYTADMSGEHYDPYPGIPGQTIKGNPDLIDPTTGEVNLFERVLYGRYPRMYDVLRPGEEPYRLKRTTDAYFVEGKEYFLYTSDESGVHYDPYPFTPGKAIRGNPDLTDPEGRTRIFEKYKVVYYVTADEPIAGEWFEVNNEATYQDDEFTLPNADLTWKSSGEGCKSCTKPIEPEDGIISWMGSVALARFAPNYKQCAECPESAHNAGTDGAPTVYSAPLMFGYDFHKYLNAKDIHGCTVVFFDRRDAKYITVKGSFGVDQNGKISCEIPFCIEDLCFCRLTIEKRNLDNAHNKYGYVDRYLDPNSTDGNYRQYKDRINELTPANKMFFVDIETFLGTMSLDGDRFDLRQIRLHF